MNTPRKMHKSKLSQNFYTIGRNNEAKSLSSNLENLKSNMVMTEIRNNPIGTPYKIEGLSMEWWGSENQNRLIVKANGGTVYSVNLDFVGADKK